MKSGLKKLAVYQHAATLVQTIRLIVDTFAEGDNVKLRKQMLANAYMLPSKIAAAEAAAGYTFRMEYATLIKIAARDLLAQALFCKEMGLNHPTHLALLINEIECFRTSYVCWVKSFDPAYDVKDEWSV